MHASLSSIVSTWNHSDTMATKFTLGTLLHWGVQSNVNEDDTSQWKLWIGIYLKCIHEQGEYFLHNSKNKRNKCINLLLYSEVRTDYPKVPRLIVFKEWRDTRTFSNLKSTHCFINYQSCNKKSLCIVSKIQREQ